MSANPWSTSRFFVLTFFNPSGYNIFQLLAIIENLENKQSCQGKGYTKINFSMEVYMGGLPLSTKKYNISSKIIPLQTVPDGLKYEIRQQAQVKLC